MHVRQFRGKRGAIYDVEMGSIASSNRIRNAYGAFYRRGSQGPPPGLSKVSISNSLTYASRVRVRMLKEIAKKHRIANPDMQIFVTSYLPRPTLKMRDKKGPMSTFTFCEAVQRFSQHFTPEFLVATAKFANVHIPREDLAGFFVLLSPDLLQGAHSIPTSPSDGLPPSTSKGIQAPTASPLPGSSTVTTGGSSSSKKRRASLSLATPRPDLSKKGRTFKVPPARGKGKGKNVRVRPLSETQAPTDATSEDDVEETMTITPMDFSKEAED